MIHFVSGDMFSRAANVRVNTVNCVGVMGKGVALAFKRRYPVMYQVYRDACREGSVQPGKLHIWEVVGKGAVVNFPTKRHWRDSSRYEDVEVGLRALREYLVERGSVTVALPALGCGHGGLSWDRVQVMIEDALGDLAAEVFVYSPNDSRSAR